MSNTIFNTRLFKEILTGYKSTLYEFYYDEENIFGEHACYIKFIPFSGPYAGQKHLLQIKFFYGKTQNNEYTYKFPVNPPNVIFLTPIYHANIGTSGSICVDVLKDENWSPANNLDTIYNSLVVLLNDPNPHSPLNSSAGKDYSLALKQNDFSEFKEKCFSYYVKGMSKLNDNTSKLMSFDFNIKKNECIEEFTAKFSSVKL